MSIKIIKLSPQRWEEYKQIRLEALKNEPTAFDVTPEEESQRINDNWEQEVQGLFNSQTKTALFAQLNDRLIGMVGAGIGETKKSRHIAVIFGMYVVPDFRGQGIAKELMVNLLKDLKENHQIEKVNLGVYTHHVQAVSLYKKLGFRIIGTLEKELKVDGKHYDLYEMEKML